MLPVVGGLIVLALIGSFTWGMAAVISSGGAESSERFVDCEGREITVDQLSPPDVGVRPVVYDSTRLEIDLRGVAD